jgi:hypothetical protein
MQNYESLNKGIRENKKFLEDIGVSNLELKIAEENIENVLCISENYFKVKKNDYDSIGRLWRAISYQYYFDVSSYLKQNPDLEIISMNNKDCYKYFNDMLKYYKNEKGGR